MLNSDKSISILYIDDEEDNLLSFKATFRRNYKIFTAGSSADGLSILHDQEVHVIIADQRMPQSTGIEFFDIVRVAHPNPIRILLTGYTDAEATIDAINKGQIYRFIKKPWNYLELETAIKNAYDIYVTRQQLHDKIAELERTNDELNRFVYSTSHDLRSPLASVMGVLNLAKMEGSVIDPNGYMGMIESCVKKMDFFILRVIEYYKSVRVDDAIGVVDFKKLVEESIDLCRMQNPAIKFELVLNQQGVFLSDSFRLSVILNNLISNAVKYQKPHEAHPIVRLVIDADDNEANILIEDNGVGIVTEHLKNVFTMFFRSNHTVNGLGIGLYIVKEALNRLGGEISVQSEVGEGTCFKVRIPTLIIKNKSDL
jgi:signal transduction histidine kinase